MAAKIKKGDKVHVLCGRSKGGEGEVLSVFPAANTALVRGINMVTKHQRPTQNQQGGKVRQEAPIHLSNLAVSDPKDGKPTRVGFKTDKKGNKLRYSKRSGEFIDKVKA